MVKQSLACNGTPITANLSGINSMKIVADKIEFEGKELVFYLNGKIIISLTLKKSYSSIYEALSGCGVAVSGF